MSKRKNKSKSAAELPFKQVRPFNPAIDKIVNANQQNAFDAARNLGLASKEAQKAGDSSGLTLDAFSNLAARLGFGSNSLLESTTYENTRLTRDFMLMVTLYRSNWLARKIIDVPAEDMVKNWYQITSKMTPDQLDQLQRLERRTKVRASLLQGIKWGRLFGGGACIMIIKGHEDHLDEPLDLREVMPGSFLGLIALDRWSGISPGPDLIESIEDPEFGLPASYRVVLSNGGNFSIHASRIIRFIGRDLPLWEKMAEMYWGISEIEVVYDELRKRDNTSFNIAGLIFLANIRVLTLPFISEFVAMAPGAAQTNLYNTLQMQNQIMSNFGMMVLPKDGSFDTKQYSFAGVNDIYESFMLDVSGAAEIPVTKLFGRSPAGMNATGEADLQNYYDSIDQKQEAQMRPALEKLLPVICTSLWGQTPDDLDFKFPSAQTVPAERLAEVAGKKTSSVIEAYNSDLITQRCGMKELRQMEDETGMFSNITEEDIGQASDKLRGDAGEMGAMGQQGQMPGQGQQGLPSPKAELNDEAPVHVEHKASKVHQIIQEMKDLFTGWRAGKKMDTSAIHQHIQQTKGLHDAGEQEEKILQDQQPVVEPNPLQQHTKLVESRLKEQLAESKVKQEQSKHDEEMFKLYRHEIKRLVGDKTMTTDYAAVDLDGTLAEKSGKDFDPKQIGQPLEKHPDAIIHNVRKWIKEGKDVRILTARVANLKGQELADTEKLIQDWTEQHLGKRLPVTSVKDPSMEVLYDDRAKEVETNTGKVK